MPSNAYADKAWQPGRVVDANDTEITNYKPSAFVFAKALPVFPYSLIRMRVFGTTSGGTTQFKISGWMENAQRGTGPGLVLWKGTTTLGTVNYGEVPLAGPKALFSGTAWYEGATMTTIGGGEHNAGQGVVIGDGTLQAMLLLPTLGFSRLLVEILSGATGGAKRGFIWHGLSSEGILQSV